MSMNVSRLSVAQVAAIRRFASRTRSTCDQRCGFGAIEMKATAVDGNSAHTLAVNALKSAATVAADFPESMSFVPAYMTTSGGLCGGKIRSAYFTESDS